MCYYGEVKQTGLAARQRPALLLAEVHPMSSIEERTADEARQLRQPSYTVGGELNGDPFRDVYYSFNGEESAQAQAEAEYPSLTVTSVHPGRAVDAHYSPLHGGTNS
jgi:hypothetical protein